MPINNANPFFLPKIAALRILSISSSLFLQIFMDKKEKKITPICRRYGQVAKGWRRDEKKELESTEAKGATLSGSAFLFH